MYVNIKTRACKRVDGDEAEGSGVIFEKGYKIFGQYDYNPSLVFDILVITTIIVQAYLYIKYAIVLKDPQAVGMFFYNMLNIAFCIFGRFVYDGAKEGVQLASKALGSKMHIQDFNIFNLRKTEKPSYSKFTSLDGMLGFGMFIVIVLTQAIRYVRLNVSNLDQFLFYTFAAPAEETFFRYFLTSLIIIVPVKVISSIRGGEDRIKLWEDITLKIIAGIVTGILFGLAHLGRYTGMDLIVITLNGIELSLLYSITRRIDAPLLAHVFLNAKYGFDILVS